MSDDWGADTPEGNSALTLAIIVVCAFGLVGTLLVGVYL